MTERVARASSRHPWRVIAAWLAAVVLAFGLIATLLEGALSTEAEVTGVTESQRAEELQFERFRPTRAEAERSITEVVVVRGAAPERASSLADELRAAGASEVVTPSDDERLVSADGDAFALLVGLGFDGEDDVEQMV